MQEEEKLVTTDVDETSQESTLPTALPAIDTNTLNQESAELVNAIITATNVDKQKDLTYLFNINQRKKTAARQNKLSDLQDKLVDEAARRLLSKPDEIDNKQLFDSMKVVQDLMERNQKQMSGADQEVAPLIQINQQNNEVSLGGINSLDRDARQHVQDALNKILTGLNTPNLVATTVSENTVAESEFVEVIEPEENSNVG